MTIVIITNKSQPLYLYRYILIFSYKESCAEVEGNTSVITDQANFGLELCATVSFPLLLYPFIPACQPADWTEGQSVDLCQNSEDFIYPLPLFLPFSLSDMQILDLLMRICCSQIPSALLALFMRK